MGELFQLLFLRSKISVLKLSPFREVGRLDPQYSGPQVGKTRKDATVEGHLPLSDNGDPLCKLCKCSFSNAVVPSCWDAV